MIIHVSIFIAIGVLFVSGLNIVNLGPKYPPTKGELWPKPQFQRLSDKYYVFKPSHFKVQIKGKTCDLLTAAVERLTFIVRNTNNLNRYHERTRYGHMDTVQECNDTLRLGALQYLRIVLTEPCEHLIPQSGMDEGYNLAVYDNIDKAFLHCQTIWGCIRGLESWAQSFYFTDDFRELRINVTHIVDYPRFPHRGLLVDTSRHYISLSNILKTLDAMAMNKMNVLHWHIVDDQSFPYESEVYPDLSGKGAYKLHKVYSKADIATVVQYARERAIRVLPEFDVPGHTRSWGEAFPEILTECYSGGKVVGLGPMDPTKNTTYNVLKNLFKEVQQRFPEKYLHVGGDEVELDCWNSNPDLKKYMKEHNKTAAQLHALFMENVLPLLGNKSQPLVWQEVFDEGVPLSSDTIVQVWKWDWVNEMVKILKAGHRLIFSAAWYLDHLKSGGDWQDFYMADPREMVRSKIDNTSSSLLKNIVGGEACMWGEVVDDTNIISRVWPRASAVAERLWSAPMDYVAPGDDLDKVRSRLEEHVCRMQRVGIHAQPPNGPGFCMGAI